MEKISYHNFWAVAIGVCILLTGCLIAYFSQKYLFAGYRGQVYLPPVKKQKQ